MIVTYHIVYSQYFKRQKIWKEEKGKNKITDYLHELKLFVCLFDGHNKKSLGLISGSVSGDYIGGTRD